jgi:predicted Abi (CAAX) family protease
MTSPRTFIRQDQNVPLRTPVFSLQQNQERRGATITFLLTRGSPSHPEYSEFGKLADISPDEAGRRKPDSVQRKQQRQVEVDL